MLTTMIRQSLTKPLSDQCELVYKGLQLYLYGSNGTSKDKVIESKKKSCKPVDVFSESLQTGASAVTHSVFTAVNHDTFTV